MKVLTNRGNAQCTTSVTRGEVSGACCGKRAVLVHPTLGSVSPFTPDWPMAWCLEHASGCEPVVVVGSWPIENDDQRRAIDANIAIADGKVTVNLDATMQRLEVALDLAEERLGALRETVEANERMLAQLNDVNALLERLVTGVR